MSDVERVVIHSYTAVFRLQRKIYRLDMGVGPEVHVPWPGGIAVRSVGYFAVALLAVLIMGGLPVIGWVLGVLHPALRFIVLPVGLVMLANMHADGMDGRAPHVFVLAWVRERFRRRPSCDGRWRGRMRIRWDDGAHRLRRMRVTGPALVRFRVPVEFGARRGALTVRPADDGDAGPVVLAQGSRMEVHG